MDSILKFLKENTANTNIMKSIIGFMEFKTVNTGACVYGSVYFVH